MPTFRPWYAIVFFLVLLVSGGLILDDYGVSWDEAIQRTHGRVSIDYAAKKLGFSDHVTLEPKHDLNDYQWSNYGMIYQITSSLLELQLGYEDSPYHYYKLRHWIAFLLFWIATIYFYRTLRLRWPDKPWYPLLGTLVLVLSPRIFANGFYNPKDHILLVFYLINVFTLLRLLKERTWRNLVLHAFATGLALNTRLPAMIVPLTTVLVFGWEFLREKPRAPRNLAMIAVYLPLSVVFLVPFFPFLWEDTFNRLIAAFSEMSAFKWDAYTLLFGNHIHALDPPFYYIPAWILITTPILYLLFMFTGIYAVLREMVDNVREWRLWNDLPSLFDFTQLGLTLGPILVVIVLGSTLYNGWRHLHFIYPGLVYLMFVGYDFAVRRWKRAQVVKGLLALAIVTTAFQMVRYHPHQYVYFNEAIQDKPLANRFNVDYWGVGFRSAMLELAATVPEGEQKTFTCETWACIDNYQALPESARTKITRVTSKEEPDYLITNFTYDFSRKDLRNRTNKMKYPFIEIAPAGNISIGVYDLRQYRAAEAAKRQ